MASWFPCYVRRMVQVTKQELSLKISNLVGISKDKFGPGSKEHLKFFQELAKYLKINGEGSKPELAKRIVEHLGQVWDRSCSSRGDTLTIETFTRIYASLIWPQTIQQENFELDVQKFRKSIDLSKPPRGNVAPVREKNKSGQYKRLAVITAYALERAAGVCELCQKPAPFFKFDGTKFLEVHHVHPLTGGGPDTCDNTVGICPNCHSEIHYGRDAEKLNLKLKSYIKNRIDLRDLFRPTLRSPRNVRRRSQS